MERNGIEVQDDLVLSAIRWFKKNITKNEKNNLLVVCKADYQKYAAGRRRFESRQRLYAFLGVLFIVLSVLVSRTLSALFVSLIVLLLLMALTLLSYVPRINIKNQHKQ
jgi:Ca2+/Na+ antiporter